MTVKELEKVVDLLGSIKKSTGMEIFLISDSTMEKGKSYLYLNPDDYEKIKDASKQ